MIKELIRKDARLSDALEAFEDGHLEKASDLCTLQIEKDEGTVPALLLRSMCRAAMGDHDSAIYDNGRALALLSLSGNELLDFADDSMICGLDGGYCASIIENAARELEQRADLSTSELFSAANAYNRAGICRYRSGSPLDLESADFEKARGLILKAHGSGAVSRDDRLLLALINSNLAECCFRGGDHTRSRALFEEASDALANDLNRDPISLHQYCYCQNCLYDIDRSEGNNVEAHRRITSLIKIYETRKGTLTAEQRIDLFACYLRRGNVRFHIGNYSGNIDDSTRAISLMESLTASDNTDDHGSGGERVMELATAYFTRAEAYEQLKDWRRAASDYGRSSELLEQSDAKNEAAQLIGLRRFFEACCLERLNDHLSASESYRLAADGFSNFGEIPSDTELPPPLPDRIMASLCHFRCGKCLCQTSEKDYHGSFTEQLKAYRILDALDETVLIVGKKAVIANSIGELFELFDDYDSASEYFNIADELVSRLDGDQRDQIVAVTERMLDPMSSADNSGVMSFNLSEYAGENVISDDQYSARNGADGSEPADNADFLRELSSLGLFAPDSGDGARDSGDDTAEDQEQFDSDGDVWEEGNDDTPKG